jgi:hypothetical protein
MSLLYISQQYTIYGGLFLLVTGIIGNGINILVFSTVRTYRRTPCTFYFLINSINSIIFLAINLISRIVSSGFGVDLTQTSLAWCKARGYLLLFISLISFICSCLATIDQFLVTSRNANLRNLSNIKWARRIILIIIIVSCLHAVPNFVYLDILPSTQTCVYTNNGYAIYRSIYSLSFGCFIPIFTMIIFGYLTYRNIHQTRVLAEQQADRQLTRMTLMQVILVVISQTPYGINQSYGVITSGISKDSDRVLKEYFVTIIVTLLTYIYFVVMLTHLSSIKLK